MPCRRLPGCSNGCSHCDGACPTCDDATGTVPVVPPTGEACRHGEVGGGTEAFRCRHCLAECQRAGHQPATWAAVCVDYPGLDFGAGVTAAAGAAANLVGRFFADIGRRCVPRCGECGNPIEGLCEYHGPWCWYCAACRDAFCGRVCRGVRYISTRRETWHPARTLGERRTHRSGRLVGCEVEAVRRQGDQDFRPVLTAVGMWGGAIVGDGSLPGGGFEVNTAPAAGDYLVRQLTELAGALAEARCVATAECGYHVHVDCRDLRAHDMRRVLLLYGILEPLFFRMQPAARRGSQWCVPCGSRWTAALLGKKDKPKGQIAVNLFGTADTRDKVRGKGHASRYSALNLYSFFYRGTLEVRLHPGTVRAARLVPWATLWAHVIDAAVGLRERDLVALVNAAPLVARIDYGRDVLTDLVPTHRAYIRERLRRAGEGS